MTAVVVLLAVAALSLVAGCLVGLALTRHALRLERDPFFHFPNGHGRVPDEFNYDEEEL